MHTELKTCSCSECSSELVTNSQTAVLVMNTTVAFLEKLDLVGHAAYVVGYAACGVLS